MTEGSDPRQGLRRFRAGAAVGLVGGSVGFALPASAYLLTFYGLLGIPPAGAMLIAYSSAFAIAGALLFALSLIIYRFGFVSLRKEDPWFYVASGLCIVGSVGLVLIIIAAAWSLELAPTLAL